MNELEWIMAEEERCLYFLKEHEKSARKLKEKLETIRSLKEKIRATSKQPIARKTMLDSDM